MDADLSVWTFAEDIRKKPTSRSTSTDTSSTVTFLRRAVAEAGKPKRPSKYESYCPETCAQVSQLETVSLKG